MIDFLFHSIKGKLLLSFLILLGMAFFFQFSYIAPTLQEQKIEEIKKTQDGFAKFLSGEINSRLENAAKELEQMASIQSIVSLDRALMDQAINDINSSNHFFNYYFVMDKDGRWLSYPTHPELVGEKIPLENMDWVSETFESGQTVFLDVVKSKLGTLVSGFSTPIRDADGKIIALLRGVFVLSKHNILVKSVEGIKKIKGYNAYLVSSNGWLIAHSNEKLNYDKYNSYSMMGYEPVINALKGQTGNVNYTYEKDAWLATFYPIPATNWGLIVQQPLENIMLTAQTESRFIIFIIVSCLCIGLFIAAVIVQKAFNPLFKLVKDIQSGSMDNISNYPKDEIGQLAFQYSKLYTDLYASNKIILQSENKFRTLFDNAGDAIYIHDFEGNILKANQKAIESSGYKQDELLNMNIMDINSSDSSRQVLSYIEKIKSGEKLIFESMHKTRTGNMVPVEISSRTIDYDHRKAILIIVRDLTERKKTSELLIQNEKMLSLGGLAAGMAHEINNPLAGIIQSAEVLANRLGSGKRLPSNEQAALDAGISMEALQKYMIIRDIPLMINAITASGLRMASIVKNMLSFARKSDHSFSTHDPVHLMDSVLKLATADFDLKKHYDFKSIALQKEYQDNLPLIICDGNKIQQVLLNILGNGAYAMFEKRKTKKNYKPEFILRISMETDAMLQIEIKDNGPGMDEKTKKKIFDPFYTTKPAGIGTGLGLSVSYFIITEDHGGTIEVASQPDKGTSFIIRIPAKPAENIKTDSRP
ncbi:MAG: PAS domain S-box protein [Proteobacteria bacterium]|nr:PAS domain S-box protein [Pseudomonadota bacterium]MBU1388866.1 PAS domain S-box protein [Pseudomonadota bacterium]MBU1542247.1 PAS domain S-box protein [Pseudomonadota bacterium]MBU2430877.1 PAS domain S-box protein [Pseudomonadota bacterium]MBU2480463.1 PAS domain S-box protein [Pseudomonadota bacterium]